MREADNLTTILCRCHEIAENNCTQYVIVASIAILGTASPHTASFAVVVAVAWGLFGTRCIKDAR